MDALLSKYIGFQSFDSKKLDVFIQLGKDLQEDVLSEMLSTYFKTTDESVTQFKAALYKKDFPAIARLSHKQKSSSGQLGLLKLHRICADLETIIVKGEADKIEAEVKLMINFIEDEIYITNSLLMNFSGAA